MQRSHPIIGDLVLVGGGHAQIAVLKAFAMSSSWTACSFLMISLADSNIDARSVAGEFCKIVAANPTSQSFCTVVSEPEFFFVAKYLFLQLVPNNPKLHSNHNI